jgi:hypothetical protein
LKRNILAKKTKPENLFIAILLKVDAKLTKKRLNQKKESANRISALALFHLLG